MLINLSPIRSDDKLPQVKYSKDALTINGVLFDFGPVPEGATLPPGAIDSPWFIGPVARRDGEIVLTMQLPHGPNPSAAVAFPDPIRVTTAGAVTLPYDPAPAAGIEPLPRPADTQEAQ